MNLTNNLISFSEYKKMKDSFTTNIKDLLGKKYTDSVWLSFTELKDYIDYIEREAKQKNLQISGIRFQMIADISGEKQLTLAMIPTKDTNGKQIDFDPVLSEKNTPLSIDNMNKSSTKTDTKGSILNKFRKCPPHCHREN